jgi:succinoglycan biosynthesis protein ExoV
MPHHELAGLGWQKACQQIGYQYIHPQSSVEVVLQQIQETEVLLTEAMHGAIVADALRIPWIPIVTNSSILSFKWLDWCESLNLEYKPLHIERLHHPHVTRDILTPARKLRHFWRIRQASQRLKQVTKVAKPVLSNEKVLDQKIEQLQLQIETLKSDLPKPI